MINWILHLSILTILAWLAFRFIQIDLPNWIFWVALIARLLAGICLGFIFYEYYSSGDTITFFEAAKQSTQIENQPRTHFFLIILRPIVVFTSGSYWLSSLYLSFASFIAFWYSLKLFIECYHHLKWVLTISLLFIPSVIFWSSGLLKDSISSAALMLLVSIAIHFYHHRKTHLLKAILFILCAFILLNLKHYVMIAFILFTGILFTCDLFMRLPKRLKSLSVFILAGALMATQYVHPYLKINRIALTLHLNNQAITAKTDNASTIDLELSSNDWIEIIKASPKALHAGLFRPSVMDKTPLWGIAHKIENLILSILLVLSIFAAIKIKPSLDWPLFLAVVGAIGLLAILLPLSTPNFGTLVRYKNAYIPFLFILLSVFPYQYLTSKSEE